MHPMQVHFLYRLLRWIRFTTTITAAYSTAAMAQMNQLYRAWPLPEGPKVYHMKMAVTSSQ